ncbi:IucA/IucC family protein [Noviherbaspirillum sp.]|uniref:IucA/IucC family protein n=1 Tax=Noviherbaspirillum sp. TaxID=1926288 RepID=UPI002DDC9691|nr:IucA/IucC family protein [Noviherbaspirillum sp.]
MPQPLQSNPSPANPGFMRMEACAPMMLSPILDQSVSRLVYASPETLRTLVDRYGSPLNIVWPHILMQNVEAFRAVLQAHRVRYEIFYGAKVNKSQALVRAAVESGIGVDVSSMYEFRDALRAGADPARLCATGPAKTAAFHAELIAHDALISIDSMEELAELEDVIRGTQGRRVRVLLRHRPAASHASRFGMGDEDLARCLRRLAERKHRFAFEGFHFHLSGYAHETRAQAMRELTRHIDAARLQGLRPTMIDIGGGMPIRYVDSDEYESFLQYQCKDHYRTGRVPASFYPYGSPVDAGVWLHRLLASPCVDGLSVAAYLNAMDLSPGEVARLSPEFNARVSVRIAALRADMAYMERMPHVEDYHQWFSECFPALWTSWKEGLNAKQLNERDWLPLPIHSWHLEHYVEQEYAAEVEEGILMLDGPDIETLPTMSFRTMAPVSPDAAPFIKLPVALWLTSEQRSLQAKSIHMGPRISTLIKRILADENGFGQTIDIFPEEVAFHYRHAVRQEDRPGRHLSVAYRAAKEALDRADGLLPVTVAALFAKSPSSGRPLVTELIERGGERASEARVENWFRHYARVVIRPVVGIYLLYGIGLEAHQQNTSVLFSDDGAASGLLIRDFGDGRTYAPLLRERGHDLKPYVHPGILPTVFTDDIEPVRSFVLNACFVCHLHELALLLTDDYAMPSRRLWDILREETVRTFDWLAPRVSGALWEAERHAFLQQPWPARSVLRMHLLRYADYRLQHALPNPLASPQGGN